MYVYLYCFQECCRFPADALLFHGNMLLFPGTIFHIIVISLPYYSCCRKICYCFIAIIAFCSVSVIVFTKYLVALWPDHLSPLRLFHGPTVKTLWPVDGPTAPGYYEHLGRLTNPCPGERPLSNRVRNDVWYLTGQSPSGHEVAIFSAHLDDRLSERLTTAAVRVISVVNWKGHAGPKVRINGNNYRRVHGECQAVILLHFISHHLIAVKPSHIHQHQSASRSNLLFQNIC